jgi:catechol 2,3-dioxygenase-like lactoylglutathione lyase family enzyme
MPGSGHRRPSERSTVNQEAAVPGFPPIAHVAVTVTDLGRSTRWYSELLAAEPILDEDEQAGGFHHTVFALDGGQLFGLHTHGDAQSVPVNARRLGKGIGQFNYERVADVRLDGSLRPRKSRIVRRTVIRGVGEYERALAAERGLPVARLGPGHPTGSSSAILIRQLA